MVRKTYVFSSKRTGRAQIIKKQKEKFPQLVRNVVEMSDVVLEILDARFVTETRNKEIEDLIIKSGKKLIYVLNKADLVDKKAKRAQMDELGIKNYLFVSCKERKGVSRLRNQIKEAAKKIDLSDKEEKRVNVGIVGYPNTGKSSLINVLIGRSSAKVGAEAGFTRGIQKLRLSKEILILDTPGIIPDEEYSHIEKGAIQKQARVGARTLGKIRDPEMVVAGLMKGDSAAIEKFYDVKAEGDVEVLMEKLGRKKNFLKKGGAIDEDRTLRLVIRDWQEGRIRV
jgi:ribosome biogenesis GTPase A